MRTVYEDGNKCYSPSGPLDSLSLCKLKAGLWLPCLCLALALPLRCHVSQPFILMPCACYSVRKISGESINAQTCSCLDVLMLL
jgi:hypothetical protein